MKFREDREVTAFSGGGMDKSGRFLKILGYLERLVEERE